MSFATHQDLWFSDNAWYINIITYQLIDWSIDAWRQSTCVVWQVKKAFYALLDNGIRAALIWDTDRQSIVGMAHRCYHYH